MNGFAYILDAYHAAFLLIPARFESPKAKQQEIAISKQESNWSDRWQIVDRKRPNLKGPARGLLQFERGGGVKGVMEHPASREYAREAVAACGVAWNRDAVWQALETRDDLAFAFGRLLLLTDPKPLPALGDEQGAFECYVRNWRPGAWARGDADERADLRARWGRNYAAAARLIEGKP